MATIEVTAADAALMRTVLSALKRGKYDGLEGTEVLAFAQGFHGAAALSARIDSALAAPAPVAPPAAAPAVEARGAAPAGRSLKAGAA